MNREQKLEQALRRSLQTMQRYKRAGLGDDVFYDDLCDATQAALAALEPAPKQVTEEEVAAINEFERGFLMACAEIANRGEATVAAHAVTSLNVSWWQISTADFSDFDMRGLKAIKRSRKDAFQAKPRALEAAKGGEG